MRPCGADRTLALARGGGALCGPPPKDGLRGDQDFVAQRNGWALRCVRFLQEFAGGILRALPGEAATTARRRKDARLVAKVGAVVVVCARVKERPLAAERGSWRAG